MNFVLPVSWDCFIIIINSLWGEKAFSLRYFCHVTFQNKRIFRFDFSFFLLIFIFKKKKWKKIFTVHILPELSMKCAPCCGGYTLWSPLTDHAKYTLNVNIKKIKLRKIVYWLVSYGYKAKLKTGQDRRAPIRIRTHWTELTLSTYSHAFIRHENWLSPNLDMRLVQWSVPRKDKSVLRVRIQAQFIIGLICLLRLISFFHVI